MVVLIERIEMDACITNRITPLCNIHSVYATYRAALKGLKRLKMRLDKQHIPVSMNENFLVISDVPGRAFTRISYYLEESVVYGTYIEENVYHLRKFNGYMRDQDKPFRYDNLGWFTSSHWAKMTKEWQSIRYLINTDSSIRGIESDLELKVFGPYDCSDMNPTLVIVPYKLHN